MKNFKDIKSNEMEVQNGGDFGVIALGGMAIFLGYKIISDHYEKKRWEAHVAAQKEARNNICVAN